MRANCIWVIVAMIPACIGQQCICDDACVQNRICAFGSEAAYNYTVTTFFNFTGCPDCLSEPGNVCQCDDCNSTASDIHALLVNNFNTLSTGGGWAGSPICHQPIMKAIMNFNTFPGDGRLEDARKALYQLCATSNGILQAGQCDGSHCHNQVPPVCEQQQGVSQMLRFLMSLFIIVCVFLFTWASEENMARYFPTLNKPDPDVTYSLIAPEESPALQTKVSNTTTSTATTTESFFGNFL